ncbi:reverse transcriptase domain-containing protein [Klebsiella michiganensis]|uniref:reverse transcriptase domain-containing protein n=1 Tax=Klebsiella michiganensis TaxID=1134687 RepID=UPI0038886756
MQKKSIEDTFNSYFNMKKDFTIFYSLSIDEEVERIQLTKKNRSLYKCSDKLKTFHLFFTKFIFNEMPTRTDIVFSYRKDVNISDAVRPHGNSEYIYKTDIANFFPSITTSAIKSKILQYKEKLNTIDEEDIERYVERITNLCTIDGRLPIGFSSSPSISNFCFYEYDNLISQYCNEHHLIYTRYADDIIISSQKEIKKDELTAVISAMISSNPNMQLSINNKKTKILTKKYERHILGVSLLTDGKITVSKKTKQDIETKLFLLKTDREKLVDYTKTDEISAILSIAGTLSQINNIDKDYLYRLRKKYGNLIISKLLKGKELFK